MTENTFNNNVIAPNITELTNRLNDMQTDFLNLAWPIGSVYISFNSTLPTQLSNLGTWTRIENRFLYCRSTSYNSGDTGGSESSNHYHEYRIGFGHMNWVCWASSCRVYDYQTNTFKYVLNSSLYDQTSLKSNSSLGDNGFERTSVSDLIGTTSSSSISTLPPYINVFAWRRTN